MSATLAPIIQEMFDTASAALSLPAAPAAPAVNFFTSVQGMTMSVTELIKANRLTLPCLFFNVHPFVPDTDFGVADVKCKRMGIDMCYVCQNAGTDGTETSIFDKGLAMTLAFDSPAPVSGQAYPFNTFFVIEPGTVDTSAGNPVNARMVADSQTQLLCVCASWTPGFQVQISPP